MATKRIPSTAGFDAQRQIRFDEEHNAFFYVACTRARRELHLLGAAVFGASGLRPPNEESLLATAWPALQHDFEAAVGAQQPAAGPARVLVFPAPGVIDKLAAGADPMLHPVHVVCSSTRSLCPAFQTSRLPARFSATRPSPLIFAVPKDRDRLASSARPCTRCCNVLARISLQ